MHCWRKFIQPSNRWLVVLLILTIAGLTLSACRAEPNHSPIEPFTLKMYDEGPPERYSVILTEAAATRLDIATTSVLEEDVVRTRWLGGQVVEKQIGVAASPVAFPGKTRVRLTLTESVLSQVDLGASALVQPLPSDPQKPGLLAHWVETPETNETLYYAVDSEDLDPGQAVLVKVSLLGGGIKKIIPYAAVIYDVRGDTWAYVGSGSLEYHREPITIAYIEGDRAVLNEGPPSGTEVVTAGVTELWGAETGVGGGGHG